MNIKIYILIKLIIFYNHTYDTLTLHYDNIYIHRIKSLSEAKKSGFDKKCQSRFTELRVSFHLFYIQPFIEQRFLGICPIGDWFQPIAYQRVLRKGYRQLTNQTSSVDEYVQLVAHPTATN